VRTGTTRVAAGLAHAPSGELNDLLSRIPGMKHLTLLLFACALAVPALADDFPTGEIVDPVACLADPSQTYALYLPAGYTPEKRWPALLVFDPRGRGRVAAEIFLDGAREHGWVVLSSNDTRSDSTWEPNVKAVNAMLPELGRRWSIDPRRVYAAGFSGGAHVAWSVGVETGMLAGVIASGGRVEPTWMVDEIPFASYGTVGTTDFNHAGMHTVDEHFGARGAAHRLEVFEGPHRWLSPGMASEAIGWMEVVAMRQGRRPVDREVAARLLAADLGRARELETDGRVVAAARRYEAIVRTYGGWPEGEPWDVSAAEERVAALRKGKELRAAEKERRRWDLYEQSYRGKLGGVIARIRDVEEPMPVGRVLRELEIERLQRRVEEGGYAAVTAERLLETVYTWTSFYLTRDFMGTGQYRRAAVVLEVAAAIEPERAGVWYDLACARAREGEKKAALEALRRAVDAGLTNFEQMRTDPDLESLHGEEGWEEILGEVAAGLAPAGR